MTTPEKLRLVTGFLTPLMVEQQPDGTMLNAFGDPEDIKRIAAGYACGSCCACFVSFQLDCPVCGLPTHVTKQMQAAPPEWQAHVDARGGEAQTPRSSLDFLRALGQDRDVEQVPLSKLGPRRNRSGR